MLEHLHRREEMSQREYFAILVQIDLDLEDRLLLRIDLDHGQILAHRRAAHLCREHRELDLDLRAHNTERLLGRHDQTLPGDVAQMIARKKQMIARQVLDLALAKRRQQTLGNQRQVFFSQVQLRIVDECRWLLLLLLLLNVQFRIPIVRAVSIGKMFE